MILTPLIVTVEYFAPDPYTNHACPRHCTNNNTPWIHYLGTTKNGSTSKHLGMRNVYLVLCKVIAINYRNDDRKIEPFILVYVCQEHRGTALSL